MRRSGLGRAPPRARSGARRRGRSSLPGTTPTPCFRKASYRPFMGPGNSLRAAKCAHLGARNSLCWNPRIAAHTCVGIARAPRPERNFRFRAPGPSADSCAVIERTGAAVAEFGSAETRGSLLGRFRRQEGGPSRGRSRGPPFWPIENYSVKHRIHGPAVGIFGRSTTVTHPDFSIEPSNSGKHRRHVLRAGPCSLSEQSTT